MNFIGRDAAVSEVRELEVAFLTRALTAAAANGVALRAGGVAALDSFAGTIKAELEVKRYPA